METGMQVCKKKGSNRKTGTPKADARGTGADKGPCGFSDDIDSQVLDIESQSFEAYSGAGGIEEIIQDKISKTIRELKLFLRSGNFITEKGDQKTNLINVAERKTYYLSPPHIEEFFIRLEECRKEKLMLHFSERQETADITHSGIMIDFDRYQRSKSADITSKHLESLTRHIAKILYDTLDFEKYLNADGEFIYHVFFIRKPSVVLVESNIAGAATLYKDGFHMLIPELQVTKGYKRYLNQELLNRNSMPTIFRDIDHIEGADKMLDKMSASNPVHFFGNSKPERIAYNLVSAYRMVVNYNDMDTNRESLDAVSLNSGFVPGTKQPVNLSYELSLAFKLDTVDGNKTWLAKRPINYKSTLETKIQLIVEKSASGIMQEGELLDNEDSVDILTMGNADANYLRKLLEILHISYATEYEKWFKVICAIAHTNTNYKPLAVWFSHRKPESWSQMEIDRVWAEATNNRFGRKPVTKRSLVFWAKESSPAKFAEINKENYFQILARAAYDNEGRVEHSMAARVLYAMVGDKFVADSEKDKSPYEWFEFVTPGQAMKKGEIYKWRKENRPDNLHLFIAEHMPKVYMQLCQNIKDRRETAENVPLAKYWQTVERTFRQFMSKLSNDGFQNGIICQGQYRFRCRGFLNELDSYEDIIGVGNGVLKIGIEPRLIKGFHEYRISKYTDTDYIPYNPKNIYIKTLLNAFHDIFPEEDAFEFMMMHASTGLDAKESACLLLLLLGGGQNGKSFFAKMIHNTLGNQYCASGKPGLLTSQMERSESANSALFQMKDKRAFYFDEFNKCETLNIARMKSIVSPGYQTGRDLHMQQSNFKNTSNPIAMSNYPFIIDTTDHGTWRRIYIYRNKVKFCSNPDPQNSWEKKEDRRFIYDYINDPLYKEAMLSIMVHYYAKLCGQYSGDIKNIPVPTIARETEEFRNSQDVLNRFITQMIVKSPGADPIGLPTLAAKYVEWYSRQMSRGTISISDAEAQFENSRIAASLERKASGTLFLVGYRVRYALEEPLQDGETALSANSHAVAAVPKKIEVVKTPEKTDDGDDYIKNLTNRVKSHIQSTCEVKIPDIAMDELDDLLYC